jgi:predicted DNA-binding transcriptional regulator YafY
VADYWEQWLAGFEARLRVGSATVRLSEAGRADLARLGAHLADHAVEIGAVDPDGWSTVEIPIETIANTARDLLLLGDDFEVLEPADLRVAVQQRAQRIASRHR